MRRALVIFLFLVLLVIFLVALVACAGRAPATRYYDLAPPAGGGPGGDVVIVVGTLDTDDAYDDERIVYRTSPVRLDYYDYHRWSAPPGVMVAAYLERGLERTGLFRDVVREPTGDAPVLTGRVAAIEEVDVSKQAWQGHLVVELRLTDAGGATLWSRQFDETQPLAKRSPEGLAEALSTAMARILARAAPEIRAQLDRTAAAGR